MATIDEITAEKPSLTVWEDGSIRIGDTRLLLDVVVESYKAGSSPERIADQFPPVAVADLYSAIGYYLRHKARFDRYFRDREKVADELRAYFDRKNPPGGRRKKILARKANKSPVAI